VGIKTMNDVEFCDWSANLAAAAVREKYPHLRHGAVDSSMLGDRVVLFFGNPARPTDGVPPIVAKLREFLDIDEVGIGELGFGSTPDRRTWAMLAHSRRDVEYCRRLIAKADREAETASSARPGQGG
jgi:hypothetical protein